MHAFHEVLQHITFELPFITLMNSTNS